MLLHCVSAAMPSLSVADTPVRIKTHTIEGEGLEALSLVMQCGTSTSFEQQVEDRECQRVLPVAILQPPGRAKACSNRASPEAHGQVCTQGEIAHHLATHGAIVLRGILGWLRLPRASQPAASAMPQIVT
jgi:hypothetical protein